MKKSESKRVNTIFICLYIISSLIVLACINRLAHAGALRFPLLDILRLKDFNTIFVLAPTLTACFAFLLYFYEGHKNMLVFLLFIIGVYMIGVGFGMHEPFNVARSVYKTEMTENIKRTAEFMDDKLGHWSFFTGFILISLSMVLAEMRNPLEENMNVSKIVILTAAGLATGAVIFANMAWEKTALDISVIGFCLACGLLLNLFRGISGLRKLPLTYTMGLAYASGLFGTLFFWLTK